MNFSDKNTTPSAFSIYAFALESESEDELNLQSDLL